MIPRSWAKALRAGLGLPDEPEDMEYPEGDPADLEWAPKPEAADASP